ncbi:(2Fe-2S)-binding protein [Amycolatopsis nigrescens]|uniref:(2Fe-2S)-binding protein n=1 Tax=Amycolatopsis nigrescens TaxID=381445 RepID=UPI000685DA61|nr:(2Fe-2S)-binding protein [Amycolatopsis nigrescens]
MPIELTVDGVRRRGRVAPRTLLVLALRETFGVTAPHVGCETGRCGACTVLLDGDAVKSCLVLAVQCDGAEVVTAAGLARDGEPHPLQTAFGEHHALQCGYCTPGMLCAAADLLRHNPNPTEDEVRQCLRGNLCRCTGYQHIVDAVLSVTGR